MKQVNKPCEKCGAKTYHKLFENNLKCLQCGMISKIKRNSNSCFVCGEKADINKSLMWIVFPVCQNCFNDLNTEKIKNESGI